MARHPAVHHVGGRDDVRARRGAWETAMRASSSSVGSLWTSSPSSTTPQWPWEVYSQRQTSVITSSSRHARADRAHRLLHDAVVRVGVGAARVLGLGQAEEDHARDAQGLDLAGLARRLVGARDGSSRASSAISRRTPCPGATKSG